MSNLRNKIKADLISKVDKMPEFDISKLNLNSQISNKRKKPFIKVALISSLSLTSVLIISLLSLFLDVNIDKNGKLHERRYSKNEISMIEENSFKKLNNIEYPNNEKPVKLNVESEFVNNIKNFTHLMYDNVENANNFSYSPLTLYNNLSILSLLSDNEVVNEEFDLLLGSNKETRKQNVINTYLNNYFVNNTGTVQTYNGLFANNTIKQQLIDELTTYYTEVYSLNFSNSKDVNKMLSWVNQAVNSEDFIKNSDLNISDDTSFYLFSTLYFENQWYNMFSKKNTFEDLFYTLENEEVKVEYMKHTSYGTVYRYENYDSFYDYYKNGYKIQYVVPRFDLNPNGNIFDSIENINFLNENENNKHEDVIINLSVPKFSLQCYYDFTNILKENGLSSAFNVNTKPFNYMYDNLENNESVYLSQVFQKNTIKFNEDGTTIKSVSISIGNKATDSGPITTITYKLNRPFIYVIYDINNIPIYLGQINNPLS